jgi:hypothetical protein
MVAAQVGPFPLRRRARTLRVAPRSAASTQRVDFRATHLGAVLCDDRVSRCSAGDDDDLVGIDDAGNRSSGIGRRSVGDLQGRLENLSNCGCASIKTINLKNRSSSRGWLDLGVPLAKGTPPLGSATARRAAALALYRAQWHKTPAFPMIGR